MGIPRRQRRSRPRTARDAGPLDDEAFDTLFRESLADVHGYAISLLGDRGAAEDVTALAFERLYRARERLDTARGTPRAWLFAIARNAALDELRRRRSRPQAELAEELVVDPTLEAQLEGVERRAHVREALAALSEREREVVLLKFHGQLTNAELSRVLGISESNAGTRLYRALSSLREGTLGGAAREEVA